MSLGTHQERGNGASPVPIKVQFGVLLRSNVLEDFSSLVRLLRVSARKLSPWCLHQSLLQGWEIPLSLKNVPDSEERTVKVAGLTTVWLIKPWTLHSWQFCLIKSNSSLLTQVPCMHLLLIAINTINNKFWSKFMLYTDTVFLTVLFSKSKKWKELKKARNTNKITITNTCTHIHTHTHTQSTNNSKIKNTYMHKYIQISILNFELHT